MKIDELQARLREELDQDSFLSIQKNERSKKIYENIFENKMELNELVSIWKTIKNDFPLKAQIIIEHFLNEIKKE